MVKKLSFLTSHSFTDDPVKGLTPGLFWKHKHDILEANRAELPRFISAIVSGGHSRDDRNPPSPITKVHGRILIGAVSDLLSRDLIRTCDLTNTAFLLLTSGDAEQGDVLPAFSSEMTILQIQVTEGKKGQIHFLEDVLPRSVDYIRQQLRRDKCVCVACNSGKDTSVGVALSALQQFFDDEGRYVASELDTPRKQIYHNSHIVFESSSQLIKDRFVLVWNGLYQADPLQILHGRR